MKLFVTVDTEADDWDDFKASDSSCSNIEGLRPVHELLTSYGARPTYLVSYQVARNAEAAMVLRSFLDMGNCEIGAHCHPWETPPQQELSSDADTMLCNLPEEQQRLKVRSLREQITESFGQQPRVFRAGRWGYSHSVAKVLLEEGFTVDTSITPYVSWKNDFGPDFSSISLKPVWSNTAEIFPGKEVIPLVELPVSIGFLQDDFAKAHQQHKSISNSVLSLFRLGGVLNKLGVLNKVWLSPEICEGEEMIALVKQLQKKSFKYVNLVFHSQSATPGLSPFARDEKGCERFYKRLKTFLEFASKEGIEGSTVSEAFPSSASADATELNGHQNGVPKY